MAEEKYMRFEAIGPNDDESDFALIHVGVKGMKWGVRKSRISSGARAGGHAVAVGAKATGHAVATGARKANSTRKAMYDKRVDKTQKKMDANGTWHPDYKARAMLRDKRNLGSGAVLSIDQRMHDGQDYATARKAVKRQVVIDRASYTSIFLASAGHTAYRRIKNDPQLQQTLLDGAKKAGDIIFKRGNESSNAIGPGPRMAKSRRGVYNVTTMK